MKTDEFGGISLDDNTDEFGGVLVEEPEVQSFEPSPVYQWSKPAPEEPTFTTTPLAIRGQRPPLSVQQQEEYDQLMRKSIPFSGLTEAMPTGQEILTAWAPKALQQDPTLQHTAKAISGAVKTATGFLEGMTTPAMARDISMGPFALPKFFYEMASAGGSELGEAWATLGKPDKTDEDWQAIYDKSIAGVASLVGAGLLGEGVALKVKRGIDKAVKEKREDREYWNGLAAEIDAKLKYEKAKATLQDRKELAAARRRILGLPEEGAAQPTPEIVPAWQAAGEPKQGGQISFAAEAPTLTRNVADRTALAISLEKKAHENLAAELRNLDPVELENAKARDAAIVRVRLALEDFVKRRQERSTMTGLTEFVEPKGVTPVDELIGRARWLGEGIEKEIRLAIASQPVSRERPPLGGQVSFAAEAAAQAIPQPGPKVLPVRTQEALAAERAAETPIRSEPKPPEPSAPAEPVPEPSKPIEQPAPPPIAPGIITGTPIEKWADSKISEGKKRLNIGVDPELMTAYAIKGAAILERGVRDFSKWSAEMLKEYGDAIKPHLRRIYNKSSNVFMVPGRYAVEGGKLKIVSEKEARRMERFVKLNQNVTGIKDQLDLFDREIGEALTTGGRFLPKELRPEVAKGKPAESGTVTSKDINQYFVNKLVTVRKGMQRLRSELSASADPASLAYFDVLQKRFELSFRQVQELRRASHESLYFWNRIKAEYQDIARMAGQMPEIRRKLPILDQLVKDLRSKEYARSGRDLVDYLRVNLFTPFSWTLDFTTNLMAVAAHTPAWLAMDLAHLATGKPATRTASALRSLKLSGSNAIPFTERFRLPEEIEVQLGSTAGAEFQGLPKEVMVDFSEILKNKPELAAKLKNVDYILGGPVRMKRAVDNFFGRFGATAELYNSAYQSGRAKGLKGDLLKEFVEEFVNNPPAEAIADAVRVGGEFKFNRQLPDWAERFASNTVTKLAVESYPRWTLQFTKWAGEMLGVDPGFFRQLKSGKATPERTAAYLAKAATGWGALYAFNQLFYNHVDPNTMEYVNEKGDRTRLSGRQPFPELYMLTAMFRGDLENAKAAFPYTSIPFASMTGGQGGLLSPIMQTMIESWKGNYTGEQTARELTRILNNALPGKSILGLIRSIYDPTVREGVGAPYPGVSQALPQRVNITTGEPLAPKQRIPGTGITLPTVGGTPFPGAVRILNPIEKTLMNHGISSIRPKRTSLIEIPAEDIPKSVLREYEKLVGQNVNQIIGEAIQSKEWKEMSGKDNFETRRDLLTAWLALARSLAKVELAEKYNTGMIPAKTSPMNVRRLPEFIKQMPP